MTVLDFKNIWRNYDIKYYIHSGSTHKKQIQLCNVEKQTH